MNISTLFYFANLGIFCGCIAMVIAYILTQTMNVMQDKPNEAIFKFHSKNTPLCGGISIFIAYIVVVLGGIEIQNISSTKILNSHVGDFYEYAGLHFYISCCIILCSGIIKDIGNKVKLQLMFYIQMCGFCVFYFLLYLLNIQHDYNMALIFISICLFLFISTNGINTIDGIHGNAALCGIAILFAICYISYQTQSNFIAFASSVLIGILSIFLLFNYPFGRMFLGDSGAFLLGFCIGALLLLCALHYKINMWYCIALLLYPICAMLSSLIIQIFFIRKDNKISWKILWQPHYLHLHTMMWKSLNHVATLIINGAFICFIVLITYYYKNTMIIFVSSAIFCLIYTICFIVFYRKNINLYHKA